MDHVISEIYYKGTILQRNYRKIIPCKILWYDSVIFQSVLHEVCYNWTVLHLRIQ